MNEKDRQFVSRGGIKLAHALDVFSIDPTDFICADLGANVGGFTDCLFQRKAKKVYAVDNGYGVLDYSLRKNPDCIVMERTNALRVILPEPVDLVTIDLGWTTQKQILPHAKDLLKPSGRIITLLKPHYEAEAKLLKGGILSDDDAKKILSSIRDFIPTLNLKVLGWTESPIRGSGGNVEFLLALSRNF